MNKCRRNAARKRRGMNSYGEVKLNVRRYTSEDQFTLLMKAIQIEMTRLGIEQ